MLDEKQPPARPPRNPPHFAARRQCVPIERKVQVMPKLVAEVTYLIWTDDGLLRHV